MTDFRPAQPHGSIQEIFNNVFLVTGTNKTVHDGVELQFSRNMIIVKEEEKLTLINTVRLNEEGLQSLDKLGKVVNVVRIGAFHGYDDAFYLDRYQPAFWAIKGMEHQHVRVTDHELLPGGIMPFSNCTFFNFETTAFREGMLLLNHPEGPILITCDSIQNWTAPDAFFSDSCAALFQHQGLIKPANIPNTWLGACKPDGEELAKIKALTFSHLLSAHGDPIKNTAHEQVSKTLFEKFKI